MLGPGPDGFLVEFFPARETGRTHLGLLFSTFDACLNHLSNFKNLLGPNPQRFWYNWSGAGRLLALNSLKAP